MQKAQSAIEFLSTYGWAILVLAVVVLVLSQLGVFNPINYAGAECLSGLFGCTNYSLSTTGILRVTVLQSTGSPINITGVGCYENQTPIGIKKFSPPSNQIFVPVGHTASLNVQCYVNSHTPYSGRVGDTFRGTVLINYTDLDAHINQSAAGPLLIKVNRGS